MHRVFFIIDDDAAQRGLSAHRALRRAASALRSYRPALAHAQHWCGACDRSQDAAAELRYCLNLENLPLRLNANLSQRPFDAHWSDYAQKDANPETAPLASYQEGARTQALRIWTDELQSDALVIGDLLAARYLMRKMANWSLSAILRLTLTTTNPLIIAPDRVVLLNDLPAFS